MTARKARTTVRFHCKTCGHVSDNKTAAERHAATHGGARIELDLGDRDE